MTNSRFRNNGQPINIAVAIRRAGKHENDVDAVVAEQGGTTLRVYTLACSWQSIKMGDGGGRRKGERHKDTDGVSFVANIYAISYPYTSPVRSCHLDSRLDGKPVVISIFHFARATRASRSSPSPPSPTINYNEATISVSTDTGEFRSSLPPTISPSFV